MSVSSAQSSLKQIEAEITREEKKKSTAETKIAQNSKKISDKEAEIRKASSAPSIQSKQAQIKQRTSELNRARKGASDAGMKLTKLYEKRRKAEQTLREEQQKENDRETQRLRRTISELTAEIQTTAPSREPNMIMQCVRPMIETFPDALELFDRAAEKYQAGDNDRNALDDIRLCFELVLKCIFANDKSLENQFDNIGRIMKGASLSSELRNTFRTLVKYYTDYQNNHVKHDESINPYEVSFIIEFTCVLMKQIIEQFGQESDSREY